MANWLRLKSFSQNREVSQKKQLVPTLSWPHLVALGIGGIVGTGIYTLIGVGAERAGPAVLIAFLIAGVVCACSALAYAELATLIPFSGGAYTYTYSALGELVAWIVGWSLILEYSLVVSTVAVSWSGYATGFLQGLGLHLPFFLTAGIDAVDSASVAHHAIYALPGFYSLATEGVNSVSIDYGLINMPAVFIVFAVAALLMLGTKESAAINAALVVIKIAALLLFIVVVLPHFNPENLHPFMPFGFIKNVSADGVERGIMAAAAIIFFSFYGFDTIATAAEETKNPKRNLSIGIMGSLIGSVSIYILVGLAAVGAVHFSIFSNSSEPLALIMRDVGHAHMATFIAVAAVVALPTVLMTFFYGQTRIFFVMGRDGLLPKFLSRVHPKTGTPVVTTFVTALAVALVAGLFKLDEIAALANSGTLVAFLAAGLSLVMLRVLKPDIPRKFKAPAAWLIGPLIIFGCIYLFISLPTKTQFYFMLWNMVGFVAYFIYGFWHSRLRKSQ